MKDKIVELEKEFMNKVFCTGCYNIYFNCTCGKGDWAINKDFALEILRKSIKIGEQRKVEWIIGLSEKEWNLRMVQKKLKEDGKDS